MLKSILKITPKYPDKNRLRSTLDWNCYLHNIHSTKKKRIQYYLTTSITHIVIFFLCKYTSMCIVLAINFFVVLVLWWYFVRCDMGRFSGKIQRFEHERIYCVNSSWNIHFFHWLHFQVKPYLTEYIQR